ncbi:flagellar hook-basal body complex protein FliE [Romboutsia sedimentorum]|jgi:flagellar hook-basal body complex protein FliE|uniref:Flagellar hook-basal body complex protein FliE n=1 Tax=Romboutsia sedimentorum TaxID=1368474 RepID=A0ABT7E6X6_9FIRM|nr:flagellar hook-basal body complex protein FliE [Romboutsia sedimentorum]MDK2562681.1 flagellar hook-basal body complex protein FliE [Romboutsia sedimentorum]
MEPVTNIVSKSNIFTQGIGNIPLDKKIVSESGNEAEKVEFSDIIKDAINKVNEKQVNANENIESLIKGENVTMHDVMLSMQESQISMQLMLEVRNKLFDAYQEVNRVQL